MPINQEGKNFYSTEELSGRTNLPKKGIERFLKVDHGFTTFQRDTLSYIAQEDLPRFFEDCLAYFGIACSYYGIPQKLQNATHPWAKTLVSMYQQPFAYGTSFSPAQGQFLRNFVSDVQPQTIVEIGSFLGISTLWMASALQTENKDAVIHAIDLFYEIMPCVPYRCGYIKDPLEFAQTSASSAQLAHRIVFHKNNSYELGKRYAETIGCPIQLLFIDGDHSIRGCMNDFALFSPYVQAGGYIILHDIYPEHCGYDGPRYLLDHVINRSSMFKAVEITTSPYNFGMAIIQKIRSRTWYPAAHWKLEMIRINASLQKIPAWNRVANVVKKTILKKVLT